MRTSLPWMAQRLWNMGVGRHKKHSAGASRARGNEPGENGKLLHQGLLFVAEKLSKHSNLRKSFFLPA